ncbi:MAG: epimerase, partial [Terriglobia bacterium]
MKLIESVAELERCLTTPSARDVESIRRIDGGIVILGAGGKMGPSLARRVQRAVQESGAQKRVLAVSRFSS